MSSGPNLRVEHSLELLRRLTTTVAEFAKKEADLLRELRNRRHTLTRKFRDALERVETRRATLTAETNTHFQAEEERVRAVFESRRARVEKIRATGLRSLPKRAQEARGKWMGDLQYKQIRAERRRNSDLAAADKAFAEFSTQLGAQRVRIVEIERRVAKYFAGYPAMLALLRTGDAVLGGVPDPEELEQWSESLEADLLRAEE
ncbi:MAG TPA: hypothetical protein VGO90_04925, partial [Chthoniobacteraceae bacterium]|nr:hypothetical protein [Chthoniobacteraceae bacterium]